MIQVVRTSCKTCQVFVGVSMETWGFILASMQVSSLQGDLPGRTGVRRKLCMVACHSCYIICGIWSSEEVGFGRKVLQSSYVGGKPQSKGK